MHLNEALSQLGQFNVAVFSTKDAAAMLQIKTETASQVLLRLQKQGFLVPLKKSLWALKNQVNIYEAASYLTTPHPSYISLQSALYIHGVIEQIPMTVYSVTTSRTRKYTNDLGHFSFHHIPPELFFGYEYHKEGFFCAKIEKAFFDFFYLRSTRTRLFERLPEIDFPRKLNKQQMNKMVQTIPDQRKKSRVEKDLKEFLRQSVKES